MLQGMVYESASPYVPVSALHSHFRSQLLSQLQSQVLYVLLFISLF